MALTLNTSHSLYAHLKLLVCVDDDGSVKDLVTPSRTVTLDTGVTVGGGTYGRHVKTLKGPDSYTPRRVSWTPLDVTRTGTAFVVVNDITTLEGTEPGRAALSASTGAKNRLLIPAALPDNTLVGRFNNSGTLSTATPAVAGSILSQGALSLATGFDVSVGAKVWKNGVLGVTDATLNTAPDLGDVAGAGGRNTQGVFAAEFVWIAIFDRILTDAEVANLHGSLGASNAFALVSAGAPPSPPSGTVTIGTITPSTTSASVAYSYSGSDATGFEYRLNGGTAASIGASPATISGLTAGTPYSIEIRAINAAGAGAWSSASNFTTSAAGDTTPPTLTGVVSFSDVTQTGYTMSWPAGSDDTGIAGYEYQIGSTAGAWTSAGADLSEPVSGRTPGATETVYVRAYDAAGLRSSPPIAGTVTLLSASTDGTITVGSALYPIKYSSESVLNESGLRATVLDATTLAEVLNTSGVVCASGVITITDPALVTGSAYHLVVKTAAGWIGISDPVTAS